MPSLKELRNRIASVKATQKITKAMQMVAAAKLRRAQESAEQSRPYADRMNRMMASVAGNLPTLEGAPPLMVGNGQDQTHLLVVVTAERGLCGAFNTAVVRRVRQQIGTLQEAGKTVKLLCVGRKGYESLRRDFGHMIVEYITLREVRNIGFENARDISDQIVKSFEAGDFDVCTLVNNGFVSVITRRVDQTIHFPDAV